MLIATGAQTSGPFLMLGLSAGNLRLLQEDRPIVRDLRPYGFDFELVILYGATEDAIAERIRKGADMDDAQQRPMPDDSDHATIAQALGLGATGTFPRGKGAPDDEGEIRMAIAADRARGVVRLEFGKEIAWVGMSKEDALELADKLRFQAGKLP